MDYKELIPEKIIFKNLFFPYLSFERAYHPNKRMYTRPSKFLNLPLKKTRK